MNMIIAALMEILRYILKKYFKTSSMTRHWIYLLVPDMTWCMFEEELCRADITGLGSSPPNHASFLPDIVVSFPQTLMPCSWTPLTFKAHSFTHITNPDPHGTALSQSI